MVKSPLLASITLKHGVFSKVLEHDRQYFRIVLYPVDADAVSAGALGTGTAGSSSRAAGQITAVGQVVAQLAAQQVHAAV